MPPVSVSKEMHLLSDRSLVHGHAAIYEYLSGLLSTGSAPEQESFEYIPISAASQNFARHQVCMLKAAWLYNS